MAHTIETYIEGSDGQVAPQGVVVRCRVTVEGQAPVDTVRRTGGRILAADLPTIIAMAEQEAKIAAGVS